MITTLVLFACAALLLLAALHDIVSRTAPNWVAGSVSLMGLGLRVMDHDVLIGLAAALAVFAVSAFFWRRGWLGGGDVKLMTAATMAAPGGHIATFIVAMSVSGSILAIIYLILGYFARAGRREPIARQPGETPMRPVGLVARAVRAELWRLRRGGPLPYACAIAAGFSFILF